MIFNGFRGPPIARQCTTSTFAPTDHGDPFRFARQDTVETAWRVVQPLLDHPGPVHTYPAGTWGPPEAAALAPPGRWWYEPWPPHGDHLST
jgi:glucose-6-phosphate 1-dehydrogenase